MRHDTTSGCQLAELQVFGVKMNDVTIADLASYNTSAIFYDGLNEFTLTDAIEYQTASTPVIDTVLPRTGSVYGG